MSSEIGSIPMAILFVVILYVLIGEYLKTNKIHIIHETSFGILIGMFVGGIFKLSDRQKYHALFRMDPRMFFNLLLPVIIFAGAYNLKKKKFLHNFKYIVLFGFVSTLLNYVITVSLTVGLNASGLVKVNKQGDETQTVNLTNEQILLYSATICATDSVAALTLISSDKYPKLFSVVFGEGMVNDAVSIILFKAVTQMLTTQNSFMWYTPFELIWTFFTNCILSLLVGVFIGCISTVAFKKFRFLSSSTTSETVFAFLMAYLGYSICEILSLSGVIGLLMCGIIMSHYQTYNISNLGKVTTRVTFDSMSLMAEAFIYVYLGFAVWDQTTYYNRNLNELIQVDVSYLFTLCQIFVVLIARILSIYIVYWITILIQGPKGWKLNPQELSISCYAGIIRGSVAFALIETLQYDINNMTQINQLNILQSSVLYIVVITTVIFGTSMPFFVNFQLKRQKLNETDNKEKQELQSTDNNSLLEEPLTPGKSEEQIPKKKQLSEAQKIIKYLDDNYFKRWFIYDYENRKKQIIELKRDIKKRDLQDIYDDAISESGDESSRVNKFTIEVDEDEKPKEIIDPESISADWQRIIQ